MGPSVPGSERGHGSLRGFTPPLLSKHRKRSDWLGAPANQEAVDSLRSSARGSASRALSLAAGLHISI